MSGREEEMPYGEPMAKSFPKSLVSSLKFTAKMAEIIDRHLSK